MTSSTKNSYNHEHENDDANINESNSNSTDTGRSTRRRNSNRQYGSMSMTTSNDTTHTGTSEMMTNRNMNINMNMNMNRSNDKVKREPYMFLSSASTSLEGEHLLVTTTDEEAALLTARSSRPRQYNYPFTEEDDDEEEENSTITSNFCASTIETIGDIHIDESNEAMALAAMQTRSANENPGYTSVLHGRSSSSPPPPATYEYYKKSKSSRSSFNQLCNRKDNRGVLSLLFTIICVCAVGIAFLVTTSTFSSTTDTDRNNRNSFDYSTSNTINQYEKNSNNTEKDDFPNKTQQQNNNNNDQDGSNIGSSEVPIPDPPSQQQQQQNENQFLETLDYVPFTAINRGDESMKASDIVDINLFHPSLRSTNINGNDSNRVLQQQQQQQQRQQSQLQPLLKVPFPTGAYWTNLVLKQTTSDHGLSYPIMNYPYAIKWSNINIEISYPFLHRLTDNISIRDIFQPDLTISAANEVMDQRFVGHFDSLSVALRYEKEQKDESDLPSFYEMYLVQGSPYLTLKFHRTTPLITALSTFETIACPRDYTPISTSSAAANTTTTTTTSNANDSNNIHNINGTNHQVKDFGICSNVVSSRRNSRLPPSQQEVTLRGVQFLIQTQENLTWMLFASVPIELTLTGISRRTIQAKEPYSGVLRLALIPPPTINGDSIMAEIMSPTKYNSIPSLSSSNAVKELITHSHLYPISGSISWKFQVNNDVKIEKTKSSSSSSSSSVATTTTKTASLRNDINSFFNDTTNNDSQNNNNKKDTNESSRTVATLTFKYETRSMYDYDDAEDIYHYFDRSDSILSNFRSSSSSSSSRSSSTSYSYNTQNGEEELLMLALPHHKQVLPSNMILEDFDVMYHCIKGEMIPVVGVTWSYDELLTDTKFDPPGITETLSSMNDDIKGTIIEQVALDLDRVLPSFTENVYGAGKQIARLANLAKIVGDFKDMAQKNNDILGKNETQNHENTIELLFSKATSLLYKYLSAFLDGGNTDKLVYDSNFGGIITQNGLLNMQEDFGNGWYNDHHFHYGYILYSSAIMAKLNSSFVSEFGSHVDSLLYDVAHITNQDSSFMDGAFFPFARHKSWYDGHSFASGLFPFADGKSQESSSEAINCYYGAYLWSLERWGESNNDAFDKTNFMRLLLAMEIRSTKAYWHMVPPKEAKNVSAVHSMPIYGPEFEKTMMVGNVGMTDVTIATWFGTESLYVHMINFLPLTAITRELFDPNYVKLEFENVLDSLYDNVEMAWRGYVIADKAILDPNAAWRDATKLRSFELDSALSKSQVYYWISTMDGFIPPAPQGTAQDNSSNSSQLSPFCELNQGCLIIGLEGECCPTPEGSMLGCCNQHLSQPSTPETTSDESSSCESNKICFVGGLTGKCCPTPDGIMLGCCN